MTKLYASQIIHRDRPCNGNNRKPQDASLRYHIHGRVLPMHRPGFFETAVRRLLGKR